MRILKRLLLAVSICSLIATANAAPIDDASAAYKRSDYAQALILYKGLAAQGNARAQITLGFMYDKGQGVPQNYQEALKWIRLAAAQGNALGQNNLGSMYYNGLGIAQDYQTAVKWFKLAAMQGDALGQTNLGWMYQNGNGVTQDYQEALKWYRLAAAQRQESAIVNLKSPEMVAAAQNSTTEQSQYTATKPNKGKSPPPRLTLNSSTPKADGSIELSGQVISDASISDISINGRSLEISLSKDNSFKVTRRLPVGVTNYRFVVTDEFGQKTDATVTVERAAAEYVEQVTPLDPRKIKANTNPNAVALIIGVESYSNLPPAQYAGSDATHFYDYATQALGVSANKIKLLTDTRAKRSDLLITMKGWMKTEVVNDKTDVYIFFAGHGLASADGNKTYLLPADGHQDLLDETSILGV